MTSLLGLAKELSRRVSNMRFGDPVSFVYNPLEYAWDAHAEYLSRYGNRSVRVLFVGMNPGPWGRVQTGVPFGDVVSVREWLSISAEVRRPARTHPKRPILGFDCERREVSGTRLWGLFADRFTTPQAFFAEHFVANYCPLAFLEEGGRNVTPDKLAASERVPLLEACDLHLSDALRLLEPRWAIGVGAFAAARVKAVCADPRLSRVKHGKILHPSPASPAANRGWAEQATAQLTALGVW